MVEAITLFCSQCNRDSIDTVLIKFTVVSGNLICDKCYEKKWKEDMEIWKSINPDFNWDFLQK